MQARAQVYNNTVVNSVKCPSYQVHSALYFGVAPQNGQTGFGHPANINPKIHHNIICMWSGSNRPMIEIRYSNEYGGMSGLSGKPAMNRLTLPSMPIICRQTHNASEWGLQFHLHQNKPTMGI